MGEFTGWPAAAVEFYRGLEADNSKAYWTAHRAEYDALVLAPMEALLDDLEGEFGEGRIFRPYRDIRFSADKSPYKTAIGATLGGVGVRAVLGVGPRRRRRMPRHGARPARAVPGGGRRRRQRRGARRRRRRRARPTGCR